MTQTPERAVPDAVNGNWVDTRAPLWLQPYLRLARIDRPIGWWLLLLPCWWSTALAADVAGKSYPDPLLLILFWLGSVAMRGAGSTYNDIVDRDLDQKVERTRNRPMASGAVSVKAGLLFCLVQCVIGLGVLFSLNGFSVLLGFCSVLPVLARQRAWPWGLRLQWAWLVLPRAFWRSWLYVPCCFGIEKCDSGVSDPPRSSNRSRFTPGKLPVLLKAYVAPYACPRYFPGDQLPSDDPYHPHAAPEE